jgi:hypothetical protein
MTFEELQSDVRAAVAEDSRCSYELPALDLLNTLNDCQDVLDELHDLYGPLDDLARALGIHPDHAPDGPALIRLAIARLSSSLESQAVELPSGRKP